MTELEREFGRKIAECILGCRTAPCNIETDDYKTVGTINKHIRLLCGTDERSEIFRTWIAYRVRNM